MNKNEGAAPRHGTAPSRTNNTYYTIDIGLESTPDASHASEETTPIIDANLVGALDDIAAWISRYAILPNEIDAKVLALWAAHTWIATELYTTPRLVISSPVPGSGKTRVLELLEHICSDPRLTVSSSPAALYRRIARAHESGIGKLPTILFDETDTIFNGRPGPGAEGLRGLINAGYKAGATVDRCGGEDSDFDVIEFPVYAPVALAGLAGHMPDTITSRAILIEMQKRSSGESVAPYRARRAESEICHARKTVERWSNSARSKVANYEPVMPPGVEDRPAEVWEPLLIVADLAGGHWPQTARTACQAAIQRPIVRAPSRSVELLEDVREVMGHGQSLSYPRLAKVPTTTLLRLLQDLPNSQWKDLNPRSLAGLLAQFSVAPGTIRIAETTAKGYNVAPSRGRPGLQDAWRRYLEAVRHNGNIGNAAGQNKSCEVTHEATTGNPAKQYVTPPRGRSPLTRAVTDVTEVTDFLKYSLPPTPHDKEIQ